jgi:spore coat protein H
MKRLVPYLLASLWAAALAPGCSPAEDAPAAARAQALDPAVTAEPGELVEDRSVYARDDLSQLPVVRLTVTDLEALERVHANEPDAEAEVLFQEGGFGAGETVPNGALRLRGQSTRLARLKSYKIKLNDGAGRWKDQRSINLNKNPWDLTRVRNYLAFEYFKKVRHMTSLRHQFVHVMLNGQDLGLYEWIEEPSDNMLEDHGLDKDGTLYKADNFSFRPWTDNIFDCAQPSDPCIEVEENSDPAKLRRMLDAVNDPARDINAVIDTHFQRGNYESWLATVILMSNYDTISQNFLLYSPPGSERWYFLPWDYNGAFDFYEQPDQSRNPQSPTFVAPAHWWRSNLHKRFLGDPANVRALHQRILTLRNYPLLDSEARRTLATVEARVRTFIGRVPDVSSLPVSDWSLPVAAKVAEWQTEWTRLGGLVSRARHDFERTVEWPMPIWLGRPTVTGAGRLRIRWDASFDAQGDAITYDLAVSRTPQFRSGDLILERSGLTAPSVETTPPAAGDYYFTVTVRDADGNSQIPFTRYRDPADNTEYFGVQAFTVP